MTDRISFNEDSSEIIRIDQQGFHYKGQFIKDAGEAYRLLVEFLRKHQPDQQWGLEHNDTPLSSAPVPVLVAERLPGAEDCDAEGRCWVHQPVDYSPEAPTWQLLFHKYASANYGTTAWLPAHALPLPAVEGAND